MNKDGFMLTIGGCPVIFTSPGINIQNTFELPLTQRLDPIRVFQYKLCKTY